MNRTRSQVAHALRVLDLQERQQTPSEVRAAAEEDHEDLQKISDNFDLILNRSIKTAAGLSLTVAFLYYFPSIKSAVQGLIGFLVGHNTAIFALTLVGSIVGGVGGVNRGEPAFQNVIPRFHELTIHPSSDPKNYPNKR